MLPLPLILAGGLAGLALTIVLLIFKQLGRQADSLDKRTLHIEGLKDEITRRDEKIRQAALDSAQLQTEKSSAQEEAARLKVELDSKDKLHQQLKVKYEQLEGRVAQTEDLQDQLQRQKNQITEQVLKYKKLEQDLQDKQDELTRLEQKNKRLIQDLALAQKQRHQMGATPATILAEQPPEKIAPEKKLSEKKLPEKHALAGEVKKEAAALRPKKEKKDKALFTRFLTPKDSVETKPPSPRTEEDSEKPDKSKAAGELTEGKDSVDKQQPDS